MEELIDKYRAYPLKNRLIALFILALIYPGLTYFEEIEALEEQLVIAQQNESTEKGKLDAAKRKVKDLPALQARNAEVEKKLRIARKYLPASVEFEKILAKMGQDEKELGVQITTFQPGTDAVSNQSLGYSKIPLTLGLRSDFIKMMLFLDRVMNMKNLVHIDKIEMKLEAQNQNQGGLNRQTVGGESKNPVIDGKIELFFFKSSSG